MVTLQEHLSQTLPILLPVDSAANSSSSCNHYSFFLSNTNDILCPADTVLEMADLVERGMGVAALRLQGSEIEANENKGVTVRLGQLSGQYFEMALRVERTNKTTYVISRQARVIPQLDIGYSHGRVCFIGWLVGSLVG